MVNWQRTPGLEGCVATFSCWMMTFRFSFSLPEAREVPETHTYILSADIDPTAASADLSSAVWLRHPLKNIKGNTARERVIQETIDSWDGAFSFTEEDAARRVVGLRKPQIGALHGIHARPQTERPKPESSFCCGQARYGN